MWNSICSISQSFIKSHLLKGISKKSYKIWIQIKQKYHGDDVISIPMLKICDQSIIRPIQIIYKQCFEKSCFPDEWKKAVSIKKWQLLKNYQPAPLLTICCKVLCNSMYFIHNNLISPNQCSFKTGDSCINQLISITHEMHKSCDDGYEVRGVFLESISGVWQSMTPSSSGKLLNTNKFSR